LKFGDWTKRVLALRGNVRVLSVTSLLGGASLVMLIVIYQPFVLSLGVSMTFLGLLEALGGRHGMITSLIQPPGGWLSDRRGRRLLVILGSALSLAALAFSTLAGLFHDWTWLIPATIALGLSAVNLPAIDSAVAESVETHERSMAYSVMMFFTILPGIFASAIGGFMADRFGYLSVFLVCTLLQGLSLVLILRFMRETLRGLHRVEWSELAKSFRAFLVPIKELRGFYLAMASDFFFWGVGSAILFGLLRKTYNFSNLQLGIMWSILSISSVCSQLPMGMLIRKYGCKKFLMLSEAIGILMMTGWLMFTSFEAFATLEILMGLVFSTWTPAMKTFLANKVSEEGRAEAMGKLAAFRGLVGFPAPFIGGVLYDTMGFRAPIATGLVGVALTLVLIFILVHE
jgi:MFS family permease